MRRFETFATVVLIISKALRYNLSVAERCITTVTAIVACIFFAPAMTNKIEVCKIPEWLNCTEFRACTIMIRHGHWALRYRRQGQVYYGLALDQWDR